MPEEDDMHLLIYNREPNVLEDVANAANECLTNEDTLHLVQTYEHLVSYIEDCGSDIDLLITDVADNTAEIIELLNCVRNYNPCLMVIFASKCVDLVYQMYEVEHIAFLPIPLDMRMVHIAMNIARHHYERNRGMGGMLISNRNLQGFIAYGDIIYAESKRRIIDVNCSNDNTYRLKMKLSDFENGLDGRFIRCHQSFIVNMQFVRMYICDMDDAGYACLELKNGERIPVSVRRQKETRNALLKYYNAILHRTDGKNIYIM